MNIKIRFDCFTCGGRQTHTQVVIFQQTLHGVGQCGGITLRCHQSRMIVMDHFGDSRDIGRNAEALATLDRVILDHPGGRYPARALEMRGLILQNEGRHAEARLAWERLLAQYPEYLFIDDVRDELRTLP